MLRTLFAVSVLVVACAGGTGGSGATTSPTTAPSGAAPTTAVSAAATSAATAAATQSAAPASVAPSMAAGETVALSDDGSYFVGPNGMSLYTFDNDEPGVSNCAGECLANWPALLVETEEQLSVADGLDAAEFSVITRSDGSLQVARNEMPLYYFIGDTAPGETNGDGVNDVWHLVTVDGGGTESTPNPDEYY